MWKYKTSSFDRNFNSIEDWLNQMGGEGWEHYANYSQLFLFKKQELTFAVATLESTVEDQLPAPGDMYTVKNDAIAK